MMLRTKTTNPEYKTEVQLIGATMRFGETARMACPKCRGGQSGEKTFVVTRDLGSVVRYHCFRASCTFSGRVSLGYSDRDHTQPRTQRTRVMDSPLEPLSNEDVDMFRNVFGLSPDRDTYWCPEKNRFAHRVYGPMGQQRGWVLRDYTGYLTPKALGYPFEGIDGPFMSWYYPTREVAQGVVIVEDMLSAKKVADAGFKSCALLGTWIDFERAYEIADVAGKENPIHLALDEGTVQVMLSYRDKFEAIFNQKAKVWLLREDLKYIGRERIRKAVVDGEINFRIDGKIEG